jgi:hypothetical protein
MENPDQEFIDQCVEIAALQVNNGSLTSPTPTPVASPTFDTKDVPKNIPQYPGAFSDFHGLPSNPVCVYRTGDEWPIPTGFEEQPVLREARPICKHPIQEEWFALGKQIYEFLNTLEVKWSTIDSVCFAEEGKDAGPLYLWVGVAPRSLSFKDARDAATGCKNILADANLPNVEIAFKESDFIQSTGPQLLNYVPYVNPTADISSPFTPTLGIWIAPQKTPHFEGTSALYLHENSLSD